MSALSFASISLCSSLSLHSGLDLIGISTDSISGEFSKKSLPKFLKTLLLYLLPNVLLLGFSYYFIDSSPFTFIFLAFAFLINK